MQQVYRWVWKTTSKVSILAMLLFFFIISTNTCSANISPNKTLTEVSFYNFTDGYYNVAKYRQTDETAFQILQETEIPYLNLSYTALIDGYLDIFINPIAGPFPYIELDDKWEINSLTYSKKMFYNNTVYFVITPPLIFSDYNSSQHVGGGLTVWEMYTWPELSGLINYTFTGSNEATIEILSYPNAPRQGDIISLITNSNIPIHNITWSISSNMESWTYNTSTLEIDNLEKGEYNILVQGYDEFNNNHSGKSSIIILPPIIEPEYFDISIFSINYPKEVELGENIHFETIIDYSTPTNTIVKYIISDPTNAITYAENQITLTGNGSSKLEQYMESTVSGEMKVNMRLLYFDNDNWIELEDLRRSFTVTVTAPIESNQSPRYYLIAIIIGLTIIVLIILRLKNIDEETGISDSSL